MPEICVRLFAGVFVCVSVCLFACSCVCVYKKPYVLRDRKSCALLNWLEWFHAVIALWDVQKTVAPRTPNIHTHTTEKHTFAHIRTYTHIYTFKASSFDENPSHVWAIFSIVCHALSVLLSTLVRNRIRSCAVRVCVRLCVSVCARHACVWSVWVCFVCVCMCERGGRERESALPMRVNDSLSTSNSIFNFVGFTWFNSPRPPRPATNQHTHTHTHTHSHTHTHTHTQVAKPLRTSANMSYEHQNWTPVVLKKRTKKPKTKAEKQV